MLPRIVDFLRDLEKNNDRIWFQENKERYETVRKAYLAIVQQLINRISLFDPDIAGLEAKDCVFRIYRDIRFSPNKLPYKNYFGAYMAPGGRKSLKSGYYFHLEPGNSLLSGGLWMPDPKLLKIIRKDIYSQLDEFVAILEEPSFKAIYPGLEGETLKRNPEGYPPSFPHDDIIRHKDFCVMAVKPDSFFSQKNWQDETVAAYEKLLPFNRFLNYTVEEYLGEA
ncbi:MAG: DUF2461 domain-containing protein [Tannerellaceae bacterium]|jgi:uncharacterized protein (TIGR02453 family)|nr:DUF2461 domain-containing protein [Tannerellaceae bacterium]